MGGRRTRRPPPPPRPVIVFAEGGGVEVVELGRKRREGFTTLEGGGSQGISRRSCGGVGCVSR